MEKEKNLQKEIEIIKTGFIEKKISEEQILLFIKKHISSDIYCLFDLLTTNCLEIILIEISNQSKMKKPFLI